LVANRGDISIKPDASVPLRITVLVPTYRRPESLARCLSALASQTRLADEVVVVVRSGDEISLETAKAWTGRLPLKIVLVTAPGVVNALNAGIDAMNADIVAITDDDAAPRSHWIEQIECHFLRDPLLGGVGGRDWVRSDGQDLLNGKKIVGRVQWFGRVVGNHHLGIGPAREVDMLKGVNMSFRRAALDGVRFDTNLRGQGAQIFNEMSFSFEVQKRGWKLIYDPAVAVDHYPAVRHDYDQRVIFNRQACTDLAFNRYWGYLYAMPRSSKRVASLLWYQAVGTKYHPGFLHLIIGMLRRDFLVFARWRCARTGISEATAEYKATSRRSQSVKAARSQTL
jgi:glycosyltransferase involved in cell wall biosynthesis